MTIKKVHSCTLDEAIVRSKSIINKVLLEYKGQYSNFTVNWKENVCIYQIVVKGQKISGQIKVDRHLLLVDISLPWTFFLFKEKIKSEIEKKLTQIDNA